MKIELWKKLQDVDHYISNHGNFKKIINGKSRIINGWKDKFGYRIVSYYITDVRKREFVHRLVAANFVTNINSVKFTVVNHIDGNKGNNHYTNLEWTNAQGNRIHAVKTLAVGQFKRSVEQYDSNGNLLNTFKSITEAANHNNSLVTAISKVVRGELKTHKGYTFKYTEDRNNTVVNLTNEEWKPVIGYENLYEVSNLGRVKSKQVETHKILIQHDKLGYLYVYLINNGKQKNCRVHRLVADAFIDNPDKLSDVNHIDHDKKNNKLTNLEWLSHKDNCNK